MITYDTSRPNGPTYFGQLYGKLLKRTGSEQDFVGSTGVYLNLIHMLRPISQECFLTCSSVPARTCIHTRDNRNNCNISCRASCDE